MRVAVIGGGGAGLLAAIAAHEAGADVILICKTPLGLGNCTAHAGGGFTLAGDGMTVERHRETTMKAGRGLNDTALVSIMAEEGPARVMGLRRFGVEVSTRPQGAMVGENVGGLARGEAMTRPLAEYVRRAGITVLERTLATDIIVAEGRPAGVEVFDAISGGLYVIPSAAVVVATGGGGRIYSRTDNPPRTTGDGYDLLARLGATFRDMEFVQFYPLGLDEPRFPVWMVDLSMVDQCRLTNGRGEEFLKPRFAEWGIASGREANLVARDVCTIEVAKQARETGKVSLHLDELEESRLTSRRDKDAFDALIRMYPEGRVRRDGPVGISPVEHYFCGGVNINGSCSTGIPGIFACGEVTGGIDGSNRVGGNALTNAVVFGERAGASAARYAIALERERPGDPQAPRAAGSTRGLMEGWRRGDDVEPADFKREINAVCEAYLGPLRDGRGLARATEALAALENRLPRLHAVDPRAVLEAFEARAMLITAIMVTAAAAERKESRGVHFRTDYPAEDPAQARPVYVSGLRASP